jgi:hypothetical protein
MSSESPNPSASKEFFTTKSKTHIVGAAVGALGIGIGAAVLKENTPAIVSAVLAEAAVGTIYLRNVKTEIKQTLRR